MSTQIQLFGLDKSSATRKARRFFSDRGIEVSNVDAKKKPPAPGELRRWVAKLGVAAVLDSDSKVAKDRGLRYLGGSEDDWIARMLDEPGLIRFPLVRCGNEFSAGDDPQSWQRFSDIVKG